LAEAFSKLLSSVSAGVLKSFRSSDKVGTQGIEYGVEWFPEIMRRLDDATDVVCLLTQHSVDRPWILYEAGVAKGKLSTPVFGIALGVPLAAASTGPFAQFQNSGDDSESLTKLVMQLVRRMPNADPDEEAVMMQVDAFKKKIEPLLKKKKGGKTASSASATAVADDEGAVAKLFEEIKVMFQDLPARLEGRLAESPSSGKSRGRLPGPPSMMLHRMMRSRGEEGSEAIGWLVFIGMYRDDLPWFYELGLDLYRAMKSPSAGRREAIEKAIEDLLVAARFARRDPMVGEAISGRGGREAHRLVRELPMILEDELTRILRSDRVPE